MRLIDFDEISFEDIYKRNEIYYRNTFRSGVRSALQYIANMPNIEQKKGKWEIANDSIYENMVDLKCSICGYTDIFESEETVYKYCPECGAEMSCE